MTSIQFLGALDMGLIYSFVALGVYLSFRVLQFPDMTVDGSFPLGASVCAALIVGGVDPYLATLAAFMAGFIAGLLTSFMATRMKILPLLTGIITMAALYSINLRIMGKPNVSLAGKETLLSHLQRFIEGPLMELQVTFGIPSHQISLILVLFILLALVSGGLYGLLSSHLGLALRATGSNALMARSQGISDNRMIALGLALSNGLVALGGALFAQRSGFADVSVGLGTIIIGLAAVIIGETFVTSRRISQMLWGGIFGAILYRMIIALALSGGGLGLPASDLNLVTAFLVALSMWLPQLKKFFATSLTPPTLPKE